MEHKGTPVVSIVTGSFGQAAKWIARAEGMTSLSIVEVPHPVAGLPADDIKERAKVILQQVIAGLTRSEVGVEETAEKMVIKPEPDIIMVKGSSSTDALHEINNQFYQKKWTDGFPIVPPTPEAVDRMLTGTKRSHGELIGIVPPRLGKATIRNIAINAVMAGAEPEYMPVIIAAVEAVLDPGFAGGTGTAWGARGMQSTTSTCTPLLIINGPIAKKLDIASGVGCLGRGYRANATIGRALRLVLTNIGGSYPGVNDMKCQGSAMEFTCCVAEKEDHPAFLKEENPWKPLNVEKGFSPDESTITAFAVWTPVCIADGKHCSPEILDNFADTMASLGVVPYSMSGQFVLVLGSTHARCLADAGLSKDDIREYLYANTQMPWGKYKRQYPGLSHRQPSWMAHINDDSTTVHIYGAPENVTVIVAGGEAPYSQFMRTHGGGVTRAIIDT